MTIDRIRGESLVIGVTSHRNLVAAEVAGLRECVREFIDSLRREFPALPLTVVSALATGGDQLVAAEALAVGARLIAVLPLPQHDYVADFADPPSRAAFAALAARATVIELPLVDDDALGLDAGDPRARDWHYAQAGIYISSHCHILLAIWDGKQSDRVGGTAQVVRYHLEDVRPVMFERRRSDRRTNLLAGSNERLAYHIVCSRDERDGAPAVPLRPLQTLWRCDDSVADGSAPMADEYRRVFARIVDYNEDARKYAARIAAAAHGIARDPGGMPNGPAGSPIERRFAVADWLALHFQRRVLFAMRSLYSIAALMGIAFISYEQWSQDYMIFVFLFLFVAGGTLARIAQRRAWHRRYLDYRALAEGLRVQAYWRRAGLGITGEVEFAHDDFLQKQDVELDWIRNVMRSAALEATIEPAPRADLAGVIEAWVGRAGHSGQLAYYERRAQTRTLTHHRTELIGRASLWTGIAISAFLAMTIVVLPAGLKTILISLMGTLSIIAGVREAYAYRKADKELIKQYRYMHRIFAEARKSLDRARDEAEQRDILHALGEAALAEHAEWTLMHRERPLERARI